MKVERATGLCVTLDSGEEITLSVNDLAAAGYAPVTESNAPAALPPPNTVLPVPGAHLSKYDGHYMGVFNGNALLLRHTPHTTMTYFDAKRLEKWSLVWRIPSEQELSFAISAYRPFFNASEWYWTNTEWYRTGPGRESRVASVRVLNGANGKKGTANPDHYLPLFFVRTIPLVQL